MGSMPRSGVPSVRVAVLGLLAVCSYGTALADGTSCPVDPSRCVVGDSYRIADSWFQFVGTTPAGRGLWLYPHVDGVHEILEEKGDGSWEGDLESVYDPRSGKWTNLFNAAEVLNELVGAGTPESRRGAARLLRPFLELHGGDDAPFYLRRHLAAINSLCGRHETGERIRLRLERRRELLSRVASPGTRVPGLATPEAHGPGEYYRRMLSDGYLDVAVVGGNLQSARTSRFLSWPIAEEFRIGLSSMGFASGRRTTPRRSSCEASCRLATRSSFPRGSTSAASRSFRAARPISCAARGATE